MRQWGVTFLMCSSVGQHAGVSKNSRVYSEGVFDEALLASATKLFKYLHARHADGWRVELTYPAAARQNFLLWPQTVERVHACTCYTEPLGLCMSAATMETYLLIRAVTGIDNDASLLHMLLAHLRRTVYCVLAHGAIQMRRDGDTDLIVAEQFPALQVALRMYK